MAYIVLVQDVSQKVFEIMMLAIENNTSMEEVVGETAELVLSVMQTIACADGFCNGTTKQGVECKKKLGKGKMYCKLHDDQRIHCLKRVDKNSRTMCSGITKKGHLCKKVAYTKEGYCYIHQYTQQTIEEKPSVRPVENCTKLTSKGHYCKGKAQNGKTNCFFHNKTATGKTCLGVTKNGICQNIIHGKNARGRYCMFHLNEYYNKIEMERNFKECSNAALVAGNCCKKIADKIVLTQSSKSISEPLLPLHKISEPLLPVHKISEPESISEPSNNDKISEPLKNGPESISEPLLPLHKVSEPLSPVHKIYEPESISEPPKNETLRSSSLDVLGENISDSFSISELLSRHLQKNRHRLTKREALKLTAHEFVEEYQELSEDPITLMMKKHKSKNIKDPKTSRSSQDRKNIANISMMSGNLSPDELLNATFVNKNDKKKKLFDKEALENLRPQEILIGAFIGSYKRVKLEEFEENLDEEDICSVFEVYVKGVKQKEDETLDIYREKLRKLRDHKPSV